MLGDHTIMMTAQISESDKEYNTKIELPSGEVQELMTRPPSAILSVGITIISVFVVSFFVSSFFIVYPEQMEASARLFPSVEMDYMDSPDKGRLLWVIDSMESKVSKGDTLAKIIRYSTDTLCLVSNCDGTAYKVDAWRTNIDIEAGQRLFFISKNVKEKRIHKVHGVVYIPVSNMSFLREGQVVMVNYSGIKKTFTISDFGSITNHEGTRPVCIMSVDSVNLFNNIEDVTCNAEIQISNSTVFESFFARRLNFFDRYKPINKQNETSNIAAD